jgi:4-hydroxymandelate oxidase
MGMTILPKLSKIPPSVASISDYERLACERLSAQSWAYIAGGAADELTLHENCAAFRRLSLRSRVLQDLTGGNTRLELFGQPFDYPLLLAPVAFQKLAHPDGERATVLAASALKTGMIVSTQASVSLEEIASQATSTLWFQLYFQHDRGFTRELVRRAELVGYKAIVVTVDAPVSATRNREQRAGFVLPREVEAVNLRGLPGLSAERNNGTVLMGSALIASAPTWTDINWLRSLTSLPILVKGIMSSEDAARAITERVSGIIVSNHGGRVLDSQPSSLGVLPDVARVVEDRIPILVDGGIRRGSDILKALALGAKAVLIGRPYIYGLATAGAIGISHIIQILRAELEEAMVLTGCRDLAAIDSSILGKTSYPSPL